MTESTVTPGVSENTPPVAEFKPLRADDECPDPQCYYRKWRKDEPHKMFDCCEQCNYNRHICPGCGDDMFHNLTVHKECGEELSKP